MTKRKTKKAKAPVRKPAKKAAKKVNRKKRCRAARGTKSPCSIEVEVKSPPSIISTLKELQLIKDSIHALGERVHNVQGDIISIIGD